MAYYRQIIAAHPEVKSLYGPDFTQFPKMVGVVVGQMLLARTVYTLGLSWPMVGTPTHLPA